MILLYISILIGVLYFSLIGSFIFGFIKLKTFTVEANDAQTCSKKLSVIIPFKNEHINLPIIVENLKNQTLINDLYEVILINDNSTDCSLEIVKEIVNDEINFKLISSSLKDHGKKKALKTGIKIASNNLIVTTDADCNHSETWLQTIYDFYKKYNPKMMIPPVIMNGNGFWGKLQALEFISLAASTAGSAGISSPIMCNGANLVFQKDVYSKFENAFNDKEISGDDIFLLQNFKKQYPKDILYLKSNDACVYTKSELTVKSFMRQRIRWASKAGSYKDMFTILTSIIVFFTNLLILFTGILSIFNVNALLSFLILVSLKFIPDIIILSIAAHFFKQTKLLIYFPVTFILYPFYIVITALWGLFSKTIKWKE